MEGEQKDKNECYKKKHLGKAMKMISVIYCFSGSNLLCDALFRKFEEVKALYIAIYVNP